MDPILQGMQEEADQTEKICDRVFFGIPDREPETLLSDFSFRGLTKNEKSMLDKEKQRHPLT